MSNSRLRGSVDTSTLLLTILPSNRKSGGLLPSKSRTLKAITQVSETAPGGTCFTENVSKRAAGYQRKTLRKVPRARKCVPIASLLSSRLSSGPQYLRQREVRSAQRAVNRPQTSPSTASTCEPVCVTHLRQRWSGIFGLFALLPSFFTSLLPSLLCSRLLDGHRSSPPRSYSVCARLGVRGVNGFLGGSIMRLNNL